MNRKQRRKQVKEQRGHRVKEPGREQAAEQRTRISGSLSVSQDAVLPRVRISPEELKDGAMRADKLIRGVQQFRDNGFLLIEGVFSERFVANLNDAYCSRYATYFGEEDSADALSVGDLRKMITVHCTPPFSDSRIYANPFVLPLLKALLGDTCIFASLGSVVSIPGSEDQHMHADHPALFDDIDVNDSLPSYAITMVTPLVELNDRSGTTRVHLGSHINTRTRYAMEFHDPDVPAGSCYLFDYRLYHGGTANRSDAVRPILYSVYFRHWFQDRVNYGKQVPLIIGKDVLAEVSDQDKSLFAGRWEPYGNSGQFLQRAL